MEDRLADASGRALAGAQRAGYYAGIITHTVAEAERPTLSTIRSVLYALEAVARGEAVARQAAQEAAELWWERDSLPRTPARAALYEKAVYCASAAAQSKTKAVYTALASVRAFEWWVGGVQAADAADRLEDILRRPFETA
jgi:hypothetical protein